MGGMMSYFKFPQAGGGGEQQQLSSLMGKKQSLGEMDWVDSAYKPACEQWD